MALQSTPPEHHNKIKITSFGGTAETYEELIVSWAMAQQFATKGTITRVLTSCQFSRNSSKYEMIVTSVPRSCRYENVEWNGIDWIDCRVVYVLPDRSDFKFSPTMEAGELCLLSRCCTCDVYLSGSVFQRKIPCEINAHHKRTLFITKGVHCIPVYLYSTRNAFSGTFEPRSLLLTVNWNSLEVDFNIFKLPQSSVPHWKCRAENSLYS